jgi:hypothetical protein
MCRKKVSILSAFLIIHLNLSRFSETEGAAVLTLLLSRYTISIKDEPQFVGETYEQRKARVLDAQSILTLAYVELLLL